MWGNKNGFLAFGATQLQACMHAWNKETVDKWSVALFSLSALSARFWKRVGICNLVLVLALYPSLLPSLSPSLCTLSSSDTTRARWKEGACSSKPHRRTRLERVARKDRTGGEPAGLHRTQGRGILVSWCLPSWCVYALWYAGARALALACLVLILLC